MQNHIKWFGTAAGGLARFNDTNWVVFNTTNSPLLSNDILNLAIDSVGNLWISTGFGLAIYNADGIVGISKRTYEDKKNFVLHQNYPNPFNPSTNIKYEILKESHVKIIIYDIIGREITTLVNQKQKIGIYEVAFDGRDLSTGIYLYRIETQYFTDTKKMVFFK